MHDSQLDNDRFSHLLSKDITAKSTRHLIYAALNQGIMRLRAMNYRRQNFFLLPEFKFVYVIRQFNLSRIICVEVHSFEYFSEYFRKGESQEMKFSFIITNISPISSTLTEKGFQIKLKLPHFKSI